MKLRLLAVAACAAGLLSACTTTDPNTGLQVRSNTGSGALIGAGAGALLGYLTNTSDGDQGRRNALIGAGIGALGGAAVGNYMDRQQAELRAQLANSGVSVVRQGDTLVLQMPSDVTFATDQYVIEDRFFPVLNDVAQVLNQYPQTTVDVVGHADSQGADDHNQTLSERRASSVAGYLITREVLRQRLYVAGMGERQPVASNATPQGRAQNRRVEVIIRPFTG